MSEEAPLPPPSDPWADAIAAEEVTPRILYASVAADGGTDGRGRECLARYVPKDGETAKTTERH